MLPNLHQTCSHISEKQTGAKPSWQYKGRKRWLFSICTGAKRQYNPHYIVVLYMTPTQIMKMQFLLLSTREQSVYIVVWLWFWEGIGIQAQIWYSIIILSTLNRTEFCRQIITVIRLIQYILFSCWLSNKN